MRLLEALALPARPQSIALVGAGGKTSLLFALGSELAERGQDVLLATTTHIFDPRLEQGRAFDAVRLDLDWRGVPSRPDRGRIVVLASQALPEEGKLRGLAPEVIPEPTEAWVLVEADGSRGRSLKAPGPHEPVIPPGTALVLGLIGLDALGRPMDATTIHRPERFGALAGCAPGEPIQPRHLAALARAPEGLFKNAPAGARRVLVLNKADRSPLPLEAVLGAFEEVRLDGLLVCELSRPEPVRRVIQGAAPCR